MVDIVDGEILLSHHPSDTIASNIARMGRDFQWPVDYLENLDAKLARLQGAMNPALELTVHRLGVPKGDEVWWVTWLLREYLRRITLTGVHNLAFMEAFAVAPNHLLFASQASTPVQYSFQFGTNQANYKSLLNESNSSGTGSGVRVKIVDTGISSIASVPTSNIVKRMNVLDPQLPVEDQTGHGTAIAEIIHDLAPDAELLVYKVTSTGKIVEWDLLAALSDDEAAVITNLSVEFGLNTAHCASCGRQSHSSRSAVFEGLLKKILASNNENIVVSAAGNAGANVLAYPARFGQVLAIGSV